MTQKVSLFGYGRHGRHIAEGLRKSGYSVRIFEDSEANIQEALADEFVDVELVDMTSDEQLEAIGIAPEDIIVCVMDDEHLNVFLTLSLRQMLPDAVIYAISDSIHTTEKLEMAGASKVIDLYFVSATRIHNFLHKPVTTRLLSGILGDKRDISFREFLIPEGSFLHGCNTDELDFDRFNLLFLGLIDVELGNELIFVTEGLNHKLDSGDTLVFMGKDEDLDRFAETIRQKTI